MITKAEAIALAKAALEPFAKIAADYEPESMRDTRIGDDFEGSEVLYGHARPNLGDFRRAREALTALEGVEGSGVAPLTWQNVGIASAGRIAEWKAKLGSENVKINPDGVMWVHQENPVHESRSADESASTTLSREEVEGVINRAMLVWWESASPSSTRNAAILDALIAAKALRIAGES